MTLQFDDDKINQKISDVKGREEDAAVAAKAADEGLPFITLYPNTVETDALRLIPEEKAREAKILLFKLADKTLLFAVTDPKMTAATEIIRGLREAGYDLVAHVISEKNFEQCIILYKDLSFAKTSSSGSVGITAESLAKYVSKIKTVGDVKKTLEEISALKDVRLSETLEIILAGAIATMASDVRIEPEEHNSRLRFRLDGLLYDVFVVDTKVFSLLLSRIKLLSSLKLNTKGAGQDGRFSIVAGEEEIEVRTSVVPGSFGESIVLRILNPKSIAVSLETLGMNKKILPIIQNLISKPQGMILTTGPTGSGKTTTLYTFLRTVYQPEVKIVTIEDPVEYKLPGIVQTQADPNKGYTFLEGLRSALRQDPDIIMIGEIRDNETARVAIDAALTGHLVFSTLHTNNAAGAFTRLIDLGVNPKVLTSAVMAAMAQRLVRKLCESCKKEVPMQGEVKTKIEKIIDGMKKKIEVEYNEKMWVPVGCRECNGIGYKGRIGVYEAILSNAEIENVVRQSPSEREIKKAAETQNILTMREDGVLKILNGTTSVQELERVVDLNDYGFET